MKAAALEGLMQRMEADGVKTCWPHPLPLYQEPLAGVSRLVFCAAPKTRGGGGLFKRGIPKIYVDTYPQEGL